MLLNSAAYGYKYISIRIKYGYDSIIMDMVMVTVLINNISQRNFSLFLIIFNLYSRNIYFIIER